MHDIIESILLSLTARVVIACVHEGPDVVALDEVHADEAQWRTAPVTDVVNTDPVRLQTPMVPCWSVHGAYSLPTGRPASFAGSRRYQRRPYRRRCTW